jgi:long-subunit fatty acid transport protein
MNAGIQFNFSTPGARSLGLGGAFLGLADDATAAYTNPAGLTILTKPEISLEGRQWNYTHTFTSFGHGFGDPTNTGVDTVAGLQDGTATNDTTGASFLSFVYPFQSWAIAVYRHELANFEANYTTQGAFFDAFDPDFGELDTFRYFPARIDMDLEIVNYGVSMAFRLGDKFTLGVGGSYYEFEMDAVTQRHAFSGAEPEGPGGFWGPPDIRADNVLNFQTQRGSDDNYGFNVGFLYRASDRFSFGGVYRQGPEFDLQARSVAGPQASEPGTIFRDRPATFNVPDVYGLGFAIRPSDAFTITFDWNHVQYSALTDGLVSLFSDFDEATARLTTDDGDEFRVGFEYVFINMSNPIALRFGGWHDPAHKVYFSGEPDDSALQRTYAGLFREGDDVFHYSVGLGFIFGESFQLDAAADFADTIDTYSLSAVVRF